MNEIGKIRFKEEGLAFLDGASLSNLRAYGREVGVERPTKKNKEELMADIVAVFTGEVAPCEISRLGAPVKNNNVDARIVARMDELKKKYLANDIDTPVQNGGGIAEEIRAFQHNNHYAHLELFDPKIEELDKEWLPINGILRGQVRRLQDGVAIVPLGCVRGTPNAYLCMALLEKHLLKNGDTVSYRAREKNGLRVVIEILSINERAVIAGERRREDKLEEQIACYPYQPLALFDGEKSNSTHAKYAEWALGLCKGQRGLILSAPKAGKSTFLYNTAVSAIQAQQTAFVLALLVGATPERIGSYRKLMPEENLTYTAYDDDSIRQVQTAELALERAKSLAGSGYDVLLVVDGLSALARAYNDTDESAGGKVLPGGLESKTLQYIKKYFGSARAVEKGGSLTMLCSVDEQTGDVIDELISKELCSIANACITMSDTLARAQTYPAVDLANSYVQNDCIDQRLVSAQAFVKEYGYEEFIKAVEESLDEKNFLQNLKR